MGRCLRIGRLVVDEFIRGEVDEVYLIYTDFVTWPARSRI